MCTDTELMAEARRIEVTLDAARNAYRRGQIDDDEYGYWVDLAYRRLTACEDTLIKREVNQLIRELKEFLK